LSGCQSVTVGSPFARKCQLRSANIYQPPFRRFSLRTQIAWVSAEKHASERQQFPPASITYILCVEWGPDPGSVLCCTCADSTKTPSPIKANQPEAGTQSHGSAQGLTAAAPNEGEKIFRLGGLRTMGGTPWSRSRRPRVLVLRSSAASSWATWLASRSCSPRCRHRRKTGNSSHLVSRPPPASPHSTRPSWPPLLGTLSRPRPEARRPAYNVSNSRPPPRATLPSCRRAPSPSRGRHRGSSSERAIARPRRTRPPSST